MSARQTVRHQGADRLPHRVTFAGRQSALQKSLLNPKTPFCVDGPANRPLSKKLDGEPSASQGRTVRPLKNDWDLANFLTTKGRWTVRRLWRRLSDSAGPSVLAPADRPPFSVSTSSKPDFSLLSFPLFQTMLTLMHAMQLFEQSGTIELSSK